MQKILQMFKLRAFAPRIAFCLRKDPKGGGMPSNR